MERIEADLPPDEKLDQIMDDFYTRLPGGFFRDLLEAVGEGTKRTEWWQREDRMRQILDGIIPSETAEEMKRLHGEINASGDTMVKISHQAREKVEEKEMAFKRLTDARRTLNQLGWPYFRKLQKMGFSAEELS